MMLLLAGYQFVCTSSDRLDQFKRLSKAATNGNPPLCNDWRAGYKCFLCAKHALIGCQSQLGVSGQDGHRVDTQDSIYPAMSVLYIQHYLQDNKWASGEEYGPASGEVVILSKL
jgi:hypothetical protein